MPTDTETTLSIHRLSSNDQDSRVWVSDGGWSKLCTVGQVVEAVRFLHGPEHTSSREVEKQLDHLTAFLSRWLDQRRDLLAQVYMAAASEFGKLNLVLVQKGRAFNSRLNDDVSQLELDLANDERFSLLHVDVAIAPGPKGIVASSKTIASDDEA